MAHILIYSMGQWTMVRIIIMKYKLIFSNSKFYHCTHNVVAIGLSLHTYFHSRAVLKFVFCSIWLHGVPHCQIGRPDMITGWCTYYTCLKRLSTFFSIVAVGTDYNIWMTGSNPSSIRFHLLNSDPDEAIRLKIWYKNPQRKDIYKVRKILISCNKFHKYY